MEMEMEDRMLDIYGRLQQKKKKIVVIMGATGASMSRLSIDCAFRSPIEIVNADSMQIYQGLDVLTNKLVSLQDQDLEGHLFGTIYNPKDEEFTSKDFRDSTRPKFISKTTKRSRLRTSKWKNGAGRHEYRKCAK